MELIYIYIDKYRNYENTELSFSGKFDVHYDEENSKIYINHNEQYKNIYPSYINNINAVVGRNSVGKTNLMDLIGMKIDDRNKNHSEYELKFKNTGRLGNIYPDDVEFEKWHTQYFMIYYLGIKDGEELFCFEGNNLEHFRGVINTEIPSENYYNSKLWFSIICTYYDGKLYYRYDLNMRLGDYEINGFNISGDYRTEGDKLAIISFRDNLNSEIYDRISLRPQDDYKIAIPRRVARLQSHLWSKKIDILLMLMNHKENQGDKMYSDEEYKIVIKYKEDIFSVSEDRPFREIYSQLGTADYLKGRLIESFINYFYNFQLENKHQNHAIMQLKNIISNEIKSYKEAVALYKMIIVILTQDIDKDAANLIRKEFSEFIDVLDNKYITITKSAIEIRLTKNTKINNIKLVIDVLLDSDYKNYMFKEMFVVFSDFFDCNIQHLSDGELYNLGMYASIFEQIGDNDFTGGKEELILVFDEPEMNMHPEMARNFINDLIKFLGHFEDKKFQIIISTHSPFILSDIIQDNILLLNKNNNGACDVQHCNISTFGANIHDILSNNFFMDYTVGEYSKSILDKVIKNLLDEKQNDKELIDKETIRYVISNIGEPILKRKLKIEFEKKYSEQSDIDYKNEIIKLLKDMKASHNDTDRDISEIIAEINNILENNKDNLNGDINE